MATFAVRCEFGLTTVKITSVTKNKHYRAFTYTI